MQLNGNVNYFEKKMISNSYDLIMNFVKKLFNDAIQFK